MRGAEQGASHFLCENAPFITKCARFSLWMIVKLKPYNQLSEEGCSAIDRMLNGITEN